PVIVQVAELAERGDPNSSAIILKQRIRDKSVEFPFAFIAAGYWLCAAPGLCAALAENRNLPVIPSVQAAISAEPDASIPVCKNGPDNGMRQTLVHSKCGDSEIAKAVEPVSGSYPNIAFTILKESGNGLARKAVRLRKHIGPSPVYMHKTPVRSC